MNSMQFKQSDSRCLVDLLRGAVPNKTVPSNATALETALGEVV